MLPRTIAWVLALSLTALAQDTTELTKMTKASAFPLGDAIQKAMKEAGEGVPFHAEIEMGKGVVVYSIDVAQGTKTCNVVLDARDGKVIEKAVEEEDHSKAAGAAKVTLRAAIAQALKQHPGAPIEAKLSMKNKKPVLTVTVLAGAALAVVKIDGLTGEVASEGPPAPKAKDPFTDTFRVANDEWASTGRSPWFVLEAGHQLVLEGRDEDGVTKLTITVLDETRKVDGVETRIVEEREELDDKVVEISRNFFAISRRTGDVHYFGEEVDIYKDGQIVSHEGAWLSGANGARFGLLMPGSPLLGARYYQEVAPGVAMDRAEVVSLTESIETPAGRFENCLQTEESTPLEKGKEKKTYAAGIGLVQDAHLKLVKHGRTAK